MLRAARPNSAAEAGADTGEPRAGHRPTRSLRIGGISENLRALALSHPHSPFVVDHVWGSAVAVACNLHLLAAQSPLPGGLHPWEPMLESDTTEIVFRDDLLCEPLDILGQVAGRAGVPPGPGLGVTPDPEILARYAVGR